MKRFLFNFIILCSFGFIFPFDSYAQTYTYRTTEFAYKQMNSYGRWYDWTPWEDSDMYITINFDTDVVKIYSPVTQTYRITQYIRNYTDSSGGTQAEYKFIDQDGDYGNMRLRIERNGNSQIYIDFANIMWVYNVRRIY